MTTTAKAPRARPKKRKSRELIAAESVCRANGLDVVNAGLVERQDEEIARLRRELDRMRAQRDGAVVDLNRLRRELMGLVNQLVLYVHRAARGCDPRERAAIEADLARELRAADIDEAGRAVAP